MRTVQRNTVQLAVEQLESRLTPSARFKHETLIIHKPKEPPTITCQPIPPGPDAVWHELSGPTGTNPGNLNVLPPKGKFGELPPEGQSMFYLQFGVFIDGPEQLKPEKAPEGYIWVHPMLAKGHQQWAQAADGTYWDRTAYDFGSGYILVPKRTRTLVGSSPPGGHDPVPVIAQYVDMFGITHDVIGT